MSTKHIIVTGATGFLGGHFIRTYLGHFSAQVHALIRGQNQFECQQKLQRNLDTVYQSYGEAASPSSVFQHIRCLCADIEQANLGLREPDLRQLTQQPIDEFWHFAASLNFEEDKAEKIFSQNVNGARNTLLLAKKLGAKRFIYISTAYTAGKLSGLIPETLHSVAQFNNTYEKSKFLAEKAVAELAQQLDIALTICRPSIVIGPEQTRQTGGTRDGLYGFIREMIKLKQVIHGAPSLIRIRGNQDTLINFIPVDRVMADILELVENDFHQPIYHLCATGCMSIGDVFDTIQRQLNIDNLVITPHLEEPDMSRLEKMLQRRTLFYSGYVNHSKQFQRGLTTRWEMQPAALEHFVRVGIEEISQERQAKRRQPELKQIA